MKPGRPQPQVVVHPGGRGAVGSLGGSSLPIQIGPGPNQANPAKLAGLHILHRLSELRGAPLLGPDLDHSLVEASSPDHGSPLLNGQGEWLLDVDILAGLTGRHTLEGMPVVGCGHDDGIELLQVKDLAKVPGLQGRGTGGGFNRTQCLPGLSIVHVAKGRATYPLHLEEESQELAASSPATNEANPNPVVGAQGIGTGWRLRPQGPTGSEVTGGAHSGDSNGLAQEVAAALMDHGRFPGFKRISVPRPLI